MVVKNYSKANQQNNRSPAKAGFFFSKLFMKDILAHPVYRFVIIFSSLFIGWYIVYDLWLHPAGNLDQFIIDKTIILSTGFLETLGYTVFTDGNRTIGIEGSSGLIVGDNCNAITLIALFSGFILAYPGNMKKKLWFVPLGCTLIFLGNVFRISSLSVISKWSYEWVNFNHTYTFTLIMYLFIFLMWMWWVEKFSGHSLISKKNAE